MVLKMLLLVVEGSTESAALHPGLDSGLSGYSGSNKIDQIHRN